MEKKSLLEWRRKLGITSEEVAQAIGCTQGYISYLERGLRIPSKMTVIAVELFISKKVGETVEIKWLDKRSKEDKKRKNEKQKAYQEFRKKKAGKSVRSDNGSGE